MGRWACALVLVGTTCASSQSLSLQRAVRKAFANQQGAGIVLRTSDSKVLATHNLPVLARRVATPGSTIKPFTLEFLLNKKVLRDTERLACRRGLSVAGVRLNCSHEDGLGPFDAEEALAFSCNSYFTEAAKRIPPGELERYFKELGFDRPTGLVSNEGEGRIFSATSISDRQLLAIGAAGIRVTAVELAAAYARIAGWTTHPTASQAVVLRGLSAATDYGLAQLAHRGTMKVAGKTGTASARGSRSTHAWFAGFAPADKPQIVVVVFVEQGRGSVEAATIAGRIFEAWGSGSR